VLALVTKLPRSILHVLTGLGCLASQLLRVVLYCHLLTSCDRNTAVQSIEIPFLNQSATFRVGLHDAFVSPRWGHWVNTSTAKHLVVSGRQQTLLCFEQCCPYPQNVRDSFRGNLGGQQATSDKRRCTRIFKAVKGFQLQQALYIMFHCAQAAP
jgi:hypothetical protein